MALPGLPYRSTVLDRVGLIGRDWWAGRGARGADAGDGGGARAVPGELLPADYAGGDGLEQRDGDDSLDRWRGGLCASVRCRHGQHDGDDTERGGHGEGGSGHGDHD
jgi:hypothetical protein